MNPETTSETPTGPGVNAMRELTMVEWAEQMRNTLKFDEQQARAFVKKLKDSTEELYDKGEMIAQAMIALRHIEDARMRFGKVIQYAPVEKQGESIYPR